MDFLGLKRASVRIVLISIFTFLALFSIPITLILNGWINWLWFWILVTADLLATVVVLGFVENLIECRQQH